GGALSVDLAMTVPYAEAAAAEHSLVLDDHTTVAAPGGSEIRVEESPGVRVTSAHLVENAAGLDLAFPFNGNGAGPGERAVTARFRVDAALRPAAGGRRWLPVFLGAAAAVGLLAWALGARRRRRAPRQTVRDPT